MSEHPDWAKLRELGHREGLVAYLEERMRRGESLTLTVKRVSKWSGCSRDEARELLDLLVTDGHLGSEEITCCPDCDEPVGDPAPDLCPRCELVLDGSSMPERIRYYSRNVPTAPDVSWVVAVHGMRSRGEWQDDFVWELAKNYSYAIPPRLYKYGRLVIRTFLPLFQYIHVLRLQNVLRRCRDEMVAAGYGERPTVIAHSLGTWLLSRVLLRDPSLKLGRVILAGSIVPPDYDWKALVDADRVDAVLCHFGGRDTVVPLAQLGIRDSGPSGRCGFNQRRPCRVLHKYEKGFRHSEYFTSENISDVMANVWRPFLRTPLENLDGFDDDPLGLKKSPWRPRFIGRITRPIMAWGIPVGVGWGVWRLVSFLIGVLR